MGPSYRDGGGRGFSHELWRMLLVVVLVDSIEQDHGQEDYELSGMEISEGGTWRKERGVGESARARNGQSRPRRLPSGGLPFAAAHIAITPLR